MRAISKTNLDIKGKEIGVSIYSAVDSETGFKQFSACCKSAVNYKKICNACNKELSASEIYKGLDKDAKVNTDALKVENGNLKFLGIVDNDSEADGYLRSGKIYFLSPQANKNKTQEQNTLIKFSYMRECLHEAKKSFLCAISLRGKENLILLKPYKKGFMGVGLLYYEQLREIDSLNIPTTPTQKEIVKEMVNNLKEKPQADIKLLANKREDLIKQLIAEPNTHREIAEQKPSEAIKTEDLKELVSF